MTTELSDTRVVPYQWICSIEAQFANEVVKTRDAGQTPGRYRYGTGVLIGPRYLLTAAHNLSGLRKVRNRWLREKPIAVRVKVGRNDGGRAVKPFWYKAKRWWVHPHFEHYRTGMCEAEVDYGLIKLKANIGDRHFLKGGRRHQIGWWRGSADSYLQPVGGSFEKALAKKKVNLSGYPLYADPETDADSTPAGIQVSDFGSVDSTSSTFGGDTCRLLVYRVDADQGHSGSPVWAKDRKSHQRYLVAIHAFSEPSEGLGYGCLMTTVVIRQLAKWGAKSLSVGQARSVV